MTSSSSPGISLMQEGISYLAGAELPCVIANIVRGGPGLGTIQPAQSDYFQAVKGGGHGDYKMIVLAPNSVQEMADFVPLGFDLAFKYRIPVMILSDGAIGQVMEKVVLPAQRPRWTEQEIRSISPWATVGRTKDRQNNIITSLNLKSDVQEDHNRKLQEKYRQIEAAEVRYETFQCEDADVILVAYGTSARICQKAVELARLQGIKLGLLRPVTLFPFPAEIVEKYAGKVKGFLSVEMSAGQMVEDIRLVVEGKTKVAFYGRMGGIVPSTEEIIEHAKNLLN